MKSDKNNQLAFFELLRAGLWERDVELRKYGDTDFSEILRLATEQSVVGLVTAGLEHVKDIKVPQEWTLQLVGQTLQLEQRNKAMNEFLCVLMEKLNGDGIRALLVKGQGIAQCYERPLWRVCGDVDLLLSNTNYEKAKQYLQDLAETIDPEDEKRLHLAMNIKGWIVELHGTLKTGISRRLNKVVEQVQKSVFCGGEVRSWKNGEAQVFLPAPTEDVFLVFSHILEHFYVEGIGLRQICDWCRLLWTYREEIDVARLERWLREARIMKEWRGFASLAVDALGMPSETMPFYDNRYRAKGERIKSYVLETGNFGHNKDNSYRVKNSKIRGLWITFWRRVNEFWKLTMIFPTQTPRIFLTYVMRRVRANV